MQTPPPFERPTPGYQPNYSQPKKSKVGLIVALIIGALLLCCALPIGIAFFLGVSAVSTGVSFLNCELNSETLNTALVTYAKNNGGKLPSVSTWKSDLAPIFAAKMKERLKGEGNDEIPFFSAWKESEPWGCGTKEKPTYWVFNESLAAKTMAEAEKTKEIILFETNVKELDLALPYKPLPFADSPVIGFMGAGEERGWMVVNAEGLRWVQEDGSLSADSSIGKAGPRGRSRSRKTSETTSAPSRSEPTPENPDDFGSGE